jgi:hypothetical protein
MRGAARPLAVGACICLLGAGAAGCSTTQEKAAAQKLESERILKARADRQAANRKRHRHHHRHVDGPKTQEGLEKSAHQHQGGGKS